jgi:hypothetical protein
MNNLEQITYNEQSLSCVDCKKTFMFTAGEQQLFAQKGYTNKPGRCPDCRAARKAAGRFGPSPGYRSPK